MSTELMDDPQADAMELAPDGTLASESKQSEGKTDEGAKEPVADKPETETDGDTAEAKDEDGEKPETSDDEDGEEDDDTPKKRKSGSQRWKERARALEAELAAERSRGVRDGAVDEGALEAIIGGPPKEEDYKGDFLAFERAQTAYEVDKRQAIRQLKAQAQQAQNARAQIAAEIREEHFERVGEARSVFKDFDETVAKMKGVPLEDHVGDLILRSDKSAHLTYHLAKNPDRVAKLNAMSPIEAAREIGRIEGRLSLPNPKTKTSAPKPVTTPKGGAAPSSQDADLNSYLKKTYG